MPTAGQMAEAAIKLRELGRYDAALALARRAVNLEPENPVAVGNLGAVLILANKLLEGVKYTKQAMAIAPGPLFKLHHNLGLAAMSNGDFGLAVKEFDYVADKLPEAAFDRACCLLLSGDFNRGWTAMEARKTWRPTDHRMRGMPEWDGHKFSGTLLVTCEQGSGDTIQFARYLPWVASQCDKVIFEVWGNLAHLFYGYPGVAEVRIRDDGVPDPDADFHVPLMSLPLHHGTTLETIPSDPGWFRLVSSRFPATVSAELATDLRVGICWAGNQAHARDYDRSIPIEKFFPIAALPKVQLFSFQIGPRSRDLEVSGGGAFVADLAPRLTNWLRTGAALLQMDLIITCDTGVAHLAGSLDVPTWVLLPRHPDWRWMLDRADSPWYPSLKLFRQKRFGDWDEMFLRVIDRLKVRARRGHEETYGDEDIAVPL